MTEFRRDLDVPERHWQRAQPPPPPRWRWEYSVNGNLYARVRGYTFVIVPVTPDGAKCRCIVFAGPARLDARSDVCAPAEAKSWAQAYFEKVGQPAPPSRRADRAPEAEVATDLPPPRPGGLGERRLDLEP